MPSDPEVSCWVLNSCFANMPLRCISVVPLRVATRGMQKSWTCIDGTISRALPGGNLFGSFPTSLPLGPRRSVPEAKCESVWMEVCTKVAAAALVSVSWRVGWG